MKSYLLMIALPLLLVYPACSPDKTQLRHVRVSYSNGSLFCEGYHQVSSKSKDSVRVGLWRFYYPDSTLEWQLEYDEHGELVSRNDYSDSGTLIYSGTTKDNLSLVTEFFDNGKLKSETVTETTKEDEAEVETSHIKDYYQTGGVRQESTTIDGELEGVKKAWDRKGNLVLQVNYRRGLIQN